MSTFDAEIFAQAVLADVVAAIPERFVRRSHFDSEARVYEGIPEEENAAIRVAIMVEVEALRQDVEATLAALEVEREGRRARALRQDLEAFLPARAEAIVEVARPHLPIMNLEKLVTALVLAGRAAIVVAKSFVTAGGL